MLSVAWTKTSFCMDRSNRRTHPNRRSSIFAWILIFQHRVLILFWKSSYFFRYYLVFFFSVVINLPRFVNFLFCNKSLLLHYIDRRNEAWKGINDSISSIHFQFQWDNFWLDHMRHFKQFYERRNFGKISSRNKLSFWCSFE